VLPVGLGVLQLALWPGLVLLFGGHVGRLALLAALPLTATAAIALSWRKSTPVPAFAVLTALAMISTLLVPGGEVPVAAVAQVVALYHVALRASRGAAGGAVLAALLSDVAVSAWTDGVRPQLALLAVVDGIVLVGLAVIGRRRREWLADRTAAARRFAEADEQRRNAADDERHRLARELHDVTAHHLTSIVVTATAAQRLGARRPELVPQALAFAADTGRNTLGALHRLVAVMQSAEPADDPAGGLTARLTALTDGFRRLGQRVDVDLTGGEPPAAVAEAVYGIARESLTNTLRYAAGATVRLRLASAAGAVTLTVDDDGAAVSGDGKGIGSGRGIAGMRDRAAALGGTVQAGPRPGGGWQVTARLPLAAGPAGNTPDSWWHRWQAGDWAVSASLALAAVVTPLVVAVVDEDRIPFTLATVVLIVAALAHGLPLLWRRHRPWTVLAVVLGTGAAWPVLIYAGAAPPGYSWFYLVCLLSEAVAVHAVAVHGRPLEWTWVAPIVTTGAVAVTLGSAVTAGLWRVPETAAVEQLGRLGLDGAQAGAAVANGTEPLDIVTTVWEPVSTGLVAAIAAGFLLMMVFLALWLIGLLPRYRRENTLDGELRQIAAAEAWARAAAHHERHRIAAGLREAVLQHTAEVEAAALRGDLDAVVAGARAALAAMRGLLNGLRPADGAQRDPQPGTAGIPALADTSRTGGRDVTVTVSGPPRPLPADVDVSAYRVVELALTGQDRTPATVRVDYTDAQLRLTLTGVPATQQEPVRAFLRARVSAVGGTLRMTAGDAVDVRLPAPAPPRR
jgi:signal transduction histidine kinase